MPKYGAWNLVPKKVYIKNPNFASFWGNTEVKSTEEEKDRGVWITKSLKPTRQSGTAVATAHVTLRQITKSLPREV